MYGPQIKNLDSFIEVLDSSSKVCKLITFEHKNNILDYLSLKHNTRDHEIIDSLRKE